MSQDTVNIPIKVLGPAVQPNENDSPEVRARKERIQRLAEMQRTQNMLLQMNNKKRKKAIKKQGNIIAGHAFAPMRT